ncbi:MucBP domain-containing protein [Pseudolactococcus paracarnosus]|uniref:MucBP domain-containing protein n=1 Tax=Pseudolactococcus paracarnosus TaxID=2749962 RepID=A0A7L4WFC4_9LACT|nr:MucBP domain-containing protein [Lactococcus paracarnosus]SPC37125.1 exported hypothetical protein [Lactococcus piscium]MCJ1978087.1 MucBP domain-containing protein [Lactococcus paracarnosus]MCJ1984230.1 MucBP domain-containing protein [Lactococcus paracarnosus]MCJ1994663.1 MucBP domain-containing protein [Lactococcus paracarnosus]MCJ1997957.1 MucBP domain-containing protein [Lactococcus paracarnosus]
MKKSKQEFSTQTNYRSLKQFSSILMCGLVLSGAMLPSTTALADTQSSSSSHAKTPSLVTSSAANTVDNMVSEAKITSPAISGELMINYVDANGVKIKTSDSYLGYVGDAVDLSSYESSFKGYTFSSADKSITELIDQDQTVTLTFVKDQVKSGTLTVNYVDDSGNQIQAPKTVSGSVGDAVDLTSYETAISGYKFGTADKAITALTAQDQTVTLTYTHDISGELTINYVDTNGVKIKTSDSLIGYVGDAVDLSSYESSFNGYTFSAADKAITELTAQDQTVTLTFVKDQVKSGTLTVNYVDDSGRQIQAPKTVSGYVGDAVDLVSYETAISGYTFSAADKSITALTAQDQTVTLTYTHDISGELTINYVDANGVKIKTSDSLIGYVGDAVDLSPYESSFNGYTFSTADKTITELTAQDQTVTLTFVKDQVKSATLTVNYVDASGKQIQAPKTVSGSVGDAVDLASYETVITGYTFSTADKSITALTAQDQTVTLTYTPAISGELMINYVDANGVKIKTSDSYLGYVGDAVDLSSYESSFKGYTFSAADKSITELTDQDQTVTLTFVKDQVKSGTLTVNYVDDSGNQIQAPKTVSGYVGDAVELVSYETAISGYKFGTADKSITALTAQDQTVTLTYTHDISGELTINYMDANGVKIKTSDSLIGYVGDKVDLQKYETAVTGYTFSTADKTITELTANAQTVTLIYTK